MGLKITITGKVHDVGYRLFLLELADSLFIEKFDARNVRIDGGQAVVVLVDGNGEQLRELVEAVKSEKPEMAIVENIKIEEYKGRIKSIEKFRAGFNTAQLSKIVHVGLKMLEKQDKMLEKQEETIREIRTVGGKVEGVSKKLDRTNELLERRFERLEEEVERIKKALIKSGIEF